MGFQRVQEAPHFGGDELPRRQQCVHVERLADMIRQDPRNDPAATAALVKLAVTRNTPCPASAACNLMSAFELTSRAF